MAGIDYLGPRIPHVRRTGSSYEMNRNVQLPENPSGLKEAQNSYFRIYIRKYIFFFAQSLLQCISVRRAGSATLI